MLALSAVTNAALAFMYRAALKTRHGGEVISLTVRLDVIKMNMCHASTQRVKYLWLQLKELCFGLSTVWNRPQ